MDSTRNPGIGRFHGDGGALLPLPQALPETHGVRPVKPSSKTVTNRPPLPQSACPLDNVRNVSVLPNFQGIWIMVTAQEARDRFLFFSFLQLSSLLPSER